jgi:hypothetical protein
MTVNRWSLVTIQGLLILAGCGAADRVSPLPLDAGRPAGFRIAALPPTLFPGSTAYIGAEWVDGASEVFPQIPSITWAVDDPAVASLSTTGRVPRNGIIVTGLTPGRTLLRASGAGDTASIAVTVIPVLIGPPSQLTVQFSVIEYQQASNPFEWYYAPRMAITVAGVDEVQLLGVRMEVPGLLTALQACTSIPLGNSETLELFPEVYGDFPLTLSDGGRATGRTATAFVSYRQGTGGAEVFRVTGPIEGRATSREYVGEIPRWSLCPNP